MMHKSLTKTHTRYSLQNTSREYIGVEEGMAKGSN